MNHRILRLTALLCVLALLVCAVPMTASAAGPDRTIGRLPTAPTIDGVIAENEWGARTMELQNYQTATVPGGAKKVPLNGDVYLAYDEEHFYCAIVAVYDDHQNSYADYDLWRGDAVQMQISANGTSDRRSFCFALTDDGVPHGYQSGGHREVYTANATGGEFYVTRDEATNTTVYEIALPLSRFSDLGFPLQKGDTLAFSFAVHMNNGYYYEWCDGIVQEKNIEKAATLTLGDDIDLSGKQPEQKPEQEPEQKPEPSTRRVLVGDVNSDGKVNTTDARLVLQYAAGLIEADAIDLEAAEVNGDQKINTTDARQILQLAAGILSEFPRGEYVEVPVEGGESGGDEEIGGDDTVDTPTTGKTVSSNSFSPVDAAAGTPFTALSDLEADKNSPFEYFALTTEANETLPFNVRCAVDEYLITAMLPAGADLSAIIPTFSAPGFTAEANGAPLVSDVTVLDLTEDVTLKLIPENGDVLYIFTLRVETLDTGLPSVALTTEGYEEIVSKEEYLNASLYLGGGAAGDAVLREATVKGRGNSSWKEPKKGYTIKLTEKAQLMDMSESKDWTLIANYEDNTLLRNTTAEYLAEGVGLDWVAQNRSVDLWYNGVYWGTYTLTEKIEIEKDRVNITEYVPGCGVGQTGFLAEFDGHVVEIPDSQRREWQQPLGSNYAMYYDPATDELFMEVGIGGKWLTLKKPSYEKLINDKDQLIYFYNYIRSAVDALYSGDYSRITQYIDVESFVKWYLVEEFMNNGDSSFHSSCYIQLDVGGKLKLGPVWDFDRSSANCDYWNPNEDVDSLYRAGSAWFYLLFDCPEARTVLKSEYKEFRKVLATLPEHLETMADSIYASQTYNFQRWDILETVVDDGIDAGWNAITTGQHNSQTFEAEIDLLADYFSRRTAQMDRFIPNL